MAPSSVLAALAVIVTSVPAIPAFPHPSLEKVAQKVMSTPANESDQGIAFNKSIQQQHPMISPTFAQESGATSQVALCRRPASHCQHLPNVTCFGNPLTYSHISFDHTGLAKIYEVKSKLSQEWEWLRSVPQCWKAVQPLLCSVYLPRCDAADMSVEMVSRHLCRAAQGPCRVVGARPEFAWPEFLKCDNEDVFSQRWSCEEQQRTRPRFNSSFSRGACTSPLVKTAKVSAFFHEFDDCGMRCHSPLFSEEDRRATGLVVVWGFALAIAIVVFGIMSHVISGWKELNRYPGATIFYMCICWAVCFIAFLMQFVVSREEMVCSGDGTRYTGGESEGSQNMLCNFNFFMLYYAFISNCIWFVILSYCWRMKFTEDRRKCEEVFAKKNAYFHMSAWLIPLIMCITVIALDLVEGKDLVGVCFVSSSKPLATVLAVICPIVISLFVSFFYTYKPLKNLYFALTSRAEAAKKSNHDNVMYGAFRIVGFLAFHFVFCIYVISYISVDIWYQDAYVKALYDFVVCRARQSVDNGEHSVLSECEVDERPNATFFVLLLGLMFFSSLAVVSWKLSGQTWATWKDFLKTLRCGGGGDGVNGSIGNAGKTWPKVARHRLVQQGYANRQGLAETGRLSMSLPSLSMAQNNPVDLYALRHMADSADEFSTSFARALPRLVQRRNAIFDDGMGLERAASSGLSRSQSVISYGSRQISLIDRRRSFDSQLSIQPSELDHLQNIYDKGRKEKRSKRRFFGRRNKTKRRYSTASRNSMTSNGGDSLASHYSQFSQVLPAVTKEPPKMSESVGGSSVLSSGVSEMGDFRLKTFRKFTNVGEQTRGHHGGAQSELPYEELKMKLATLSQSVDTSKAVDTACASVQG